MNTKHIQYFFIVFAALTLHGFVQAEQPETVGVSGNLTIFNSLLDNDANFDQYASSLVLSYSAVRGDTVPAGTGNKALNDNYDSNFDSHAQPLNERSYYVANNPLLVNGGTPAA